MGVDWYRMRLKSGTDVEELRRLARSEAIAYQSMSGWYPVSTKNPVTTSLFCELHSANCATAATAVRQQVELARWDRERDCATDNRDLTPAWRVSVIAGNITFPPLVRCRAFRTVLPDELPEQLAEWRAWGESVTLGTHDQYLRELHWYATADWASYHWTCLHNAASDSLTATGAWAIRPTIDHIRNEILRLPQPYVPDIAIAPDRPSSDRERMTTEYPALLSAARTLAELTRQWDSCVRGNKKLRYYENCYQLTLDEFRALASGEWLREFFTWIERCIELGLGLALDP